MHQQDRSLWEQLYSEVEPWRRGRVVVILIGGFYLLQQMAILWANLQVGNLEALLATAAVCAVFWLFFYLIWIGVNWIRWLAGGWAWLNGFVYLIWAMRDRNPVVAVAGSINFLIGTYFCLAPSVYFFAKRQRENRSWTHSGMVAGCFCLLSITFVIGAVGLFGFRARAKATAIEFAQDAAQRMYHDYDRGWLLTHSRPEALAASGPRAVVVAFDDANHFMGPVSHICISSSDARIVYRLPARLICEARVIADGISANGHARLYFWIVDSGQGWQLQSTWWEHPGTPMPDC